MSLPASAPAPAPVSTSSARAWMVLGLLWVVAVSFYRRGMDLKQRRELLGERRSLALGLGLPASLLCAVPLLAIVVMPVAFVGGVLVSAEVLRSTDTAAVGS